MSDLKRKLLLVLFGLLLPVVLLAALEGVLAVFGLGEDARYDDPFVGFAPGSPLFEEVTVDGRRLYRTRPEKLAFFNEQSFPAEKAPGTFRIFTLGGSTTAGRPYDDRLSFSHWLRLYLQAADPAGRYEVINCGAVSYASDRIARLMQELAGYEPDLFVVYTGHNEFLEERAYSDLIHQPELVKGLRMALSRFRFAALARKALGPPPAPRLQTDELVTRLDAWTGLDAYHRDQELEDTVVEHFRSNLGRMRSIAGSAGAGALFVQPIANLKDFSPFKAEPGRRLTEDDEERLAGLLSRGRELLEEGRPGEALAFLEEAETLAPEHAGVRFRQGQALFALGRMAEAEAAFTSAKDLDAAPLRILERLAAEIRAAASRTDIPLVDLPAVLGAELQRDLGHSIFGNEMLQDHVHPTVDVHARIAELLVEELARQEVLDPGPGWTEGERKEIRRRHLESLDARYYARRDLNLGKVLGWAGKLEEAEAPLRRAAEVLADEPGAWLNLGVLLQKTGRPAESVAALERAVELQPRSAVARFNLGVSYGQLGRSKEGAEALRKAVALRPDYPEAWYDLGVLEADLGDGEAAAVSLGKALELAPEKPETLLALARVKADGGALEEAEALLGRAETLAPESPEVLYRRGLLASRRGSREEARAAHRRALDLDPGHAGALNSLGVLAAGEGDLQEASELLIRAIERDPAYAEAYFNLGVVYDNAGRPREALQVLERAVALAPETPRFRLALGLVHFALGEADLARPHLEAARAAGLEIPPAARSVLAP